MPLKLSPIVRVLATALLACSLACVLALPASAVDVRYIAYGDSVTEGTSFDETCGCDARECRQVCGYPVRLKRLLADVGVDAQVFNEGLGGERTPGGLERLDEVLASLPPSDVLLLMEGTNDIRRNIPPESTLFNLEEMTAKAAAAGMTTVHATLIPRFPAADRDPENVENGALCAGIRDLAFIHGRDLVDPFTVFNGIDDLFTTHYAEGFPDDPVGHPNSAGFDVLAEAFFEVLQGGEDTVPPGLGRVTPPDGAVDVSPFAPVTVRLYDFGLGIDRSFTNLTVNGEPVPLAGGGGGSWQELTYTPLTALPETVEVRLMARDFNFNTVELRATTFMVDTEAPGPCVADAATLCIDDELGDQRFKITLSFETASGGGSAGDAAPINLAQVGLRRGGLFSFFDPKNPEILVKVLNGCQNNNHYWVFVAPTTTVGYTMNIVDTVAARQGALRADYEIVVTNQDGVAAKPFGDTAAFPTCAFKATVPQP